jgi:hypothetical protein
MENIPELIFAEDPYEDMRQQKSEAQKRKSDEEYFDCLRWLKNNKPDQWERQLELLTTTARGVKITFKEEL